MLPSLLLPDSSNGDMKMPEPKNPVILICSPYLALAGCTSIWQAARLSGVEHVELLVDSTLTCPDLRKNPSLASDVKTRSSAERIKSEAAASGVEIELFVAPLHLKAGMQSAPEWAKTLLETASSAGAHRVSFPLVTDNFVVPEIPDQDYLDSAIRIFSSLVEAAAKSGIRVLFENLSVYLNRPEILGRILNEFTREELGFCFDPVNLCWYGHPREAVYRITKELAPRCTGLHVKNIKYPADKVESHREPGWRYDELVVPAEKGDLDFSLVIRSLTTAEFDGYYGIEDDSLNLVAEPERVAILRSSVEYVEEILELTATKSSTSIPDQKGRQRN